MQNQGFRTGQHVVSMRFLLVIFKFLFRMDQATSFNCTANYLEASLKDKQINTYLSCPHIPLGESLGNQMHLIFLKYTYQKNRTFCTLSLDNPIYKHILIMYYNDTIMISNDTMMMNNDTIMIKNTLHTIQILQTIKCTKCLKKMT